MNLLHTLFWTILLTHVAAAQVSWQQTRGPYGADGPYLPLGRDLPTPLLVAPSGSVFFATGLGLYRSDDRGRSWTKVLDSVVYSLATGPSDRIYAGGSELMVSSDNGWTWKTRPIEAPPGSRIIITSIRSAGPDTIEAMIRPYSGIGDLPTAPSGILRRSTDGGETWSNEDKYIAEGNVRSFAPGREGTFICITDRGIQRVDSTRMMQEEYVLTDTMTSDLFIAANNIWLVGTADTIYMSADSGTTWGTWPPRLGASAFARHSNGSIVWMNENVLGYAHAFGEPSNHIDISVPNMSTLAITIGDTLLTDFDGKGVFRAYDRGIWRRDIDGVLNAHITATVMGPEGTLFASTTALETWKTTNRGESWSPADNGIPTEPDSTWMNRRKGVTLLPRRAGWPLAGVLEDTLYTWDEGTEQWSRYLQLPAGWTFVTFGAAKEIVVATPTTVRHTTDEGVTWRSIDTPGGVVAEAFPTRDGELLIRRTASGTDSYFRSVDGKSWMPIAPDGPFPGRHLGPLVHNDVTGDFHISCYNTTFFTEPGEYGATYYGSAHIYESTDGGLTWHDVGGALEQRDRAIAGYTIGPRGVLYTLTQPTDGPFGTSRIFKYEHGNWEIIASSTPIATRTIAVAPDYYVYAGTEVGGVYRSSGPSSSAPNGSERSATIPEPRATPNPFTGSTTITFTPAARSFLRVEAIDALGRVVSTIAEGIFGEETTSVVWEPKDIAPGSYFITISDVNGRTSHTAVTLSR